MKTLEEIFIEIGIKDEKKMLDKVILKANSDEGEALEFLFLSNKYFFFFYFLYTNFKSRNTSS